MYVRGRGGFNKINQDYYYPAELELLLRGITNFSFFFFNLIFAR